MKIGLITMHNVNNYGAVLQTYALYSQLEILGHECTIINYIPNVRRGIKVVFPPSNTPLIKKILSWIKWMPAHITRIKCFKEFQYKYYKNITQNIFMTLLNSVHRSLIFILLGAIKCGTQIRQWDLTLITFTICF